MMLLKNFWQCQLKLSSFWEVISVSTQDVLDFFLINREFENDKQTLHFEISQV